MKSHTSPCSNNSTHRGTNLSRLKTPSRTWQLISVTSSSLKPGAKAGEEGGLFADGEDEPVGTMRHTLSLLFRRVAAIIGEDAPAPALDVLLLLSAAVVARRYAKGSFWGSWNSVDATMMGFDCALQHVRVA